jgi:hypothetical protein
MGDFKVLYIGTVVMLFLSLCLIGFVVWATGQMKQHRNFTIERDKRYLERIEAVELLVKTEFQEVLNQIKKL